MLDLLIQHVNLPDGRRDQSVAVQDGRIVEVAAGLQAPAHETLDGQGRLLSPPFVDAHFHMDSTLSYGLPRINQSGTLLEGIALWGELKPHLTHEAIVQRALSYCDWALACWPSARMWMCAMTGCWRYRPCSRSRRPWRPTSTCSWWPFRRTGCCARPRP